MATGGPPRVMYIVSSDEDGVGTQENFSSQINISTAQVIDLVSEEDIEDEQDKIDAIKEEDCTAALGILETADTYKDIRKRSKKMKLKNNPQPKPKSRKARYKVLRKPVRSSARSSQIHHLPAMQAAFLKRFETLEDLVVRLRTRFKLETLTVPDQADQDDDVTTHAAQVPALESENVGSDGTHTEVNETPAAPNGVKYLKQCGNPEGWPEGVKYLKECDNPEGLLFKDTGKFDPCQCYLNCFYKTCQNSASAYYCTRTSCALKGRCSNSMYENSSVEIVSTPRGLGLRALDDIPVGAFIGEYTGRLTTFDITASDHHYEYALEIHEKTQTKMTAYIDAEKCGGITRFANHSCEPNCHFVEMRNRRLLRVVMLVIDKILAGQEITVHYGDKLWFDCSCNTESCIGPTIPDVVKDKEDD